MRSKLLYTLVFVIVLLGMHFDSYSAEQPLFFTHFTAEQSGLSHNGVLCILEDSRGYVWIGTKMGLNRYDGKRIKTYYSSSLNSNYILSLCEDKSGNVWIGTSDGVAYYDHTRDRMNSLDFHLQGSTCFISSIICDSNGTVWFDAGTDCLYSIDPSDKTLTEHQLNLPDCSKKLAVDGRNRIAINCNQNNIYLFNGESAVPLLKGWSQDGIFENDEFNNPFFSRKSNDILYIASKRNGLCELNLSTKKVSVLHRWCPGQKPVSIFVDDNEVIYVCTSSGLVQYDLRKSQVKTYFHSNSDSYTLSGDYLTCTFIDSRGGLWVGAREYGVNYSQKEELFKRIYALSDGGSLNGCMVRGVSEDTDGRLWIATERKGLLRYNPVDGTVVRMYEWMLPFFITSVLCNGPFVWVGTQNGIFRLDQKSGKIRHYFADSKVERENRVLSIFNSTHAGILVGSTSGVLSYDSKRDLFIPVEQLDGISIEGFAEDSDGKIWLATYSDGVVVWDPSRNDPPKHFGRETSGMVSSIFIDKDKRIWAIGNGSEFALYDIASDKFVRYNKNSFPSLPDASFISALQDVDGYIWMSTTSGLIRFDPQLSAVRHFTERSGLLNNCFGRPALKTSSGDLVLGSLDGLVILNSSVNKIMGVTPIHSDIVSVLVDGREYIPETHDFIHLPSGTKSVNIEIATPGSGVFSAIYARLSPKESSFSDISTPMSLKYADLKPGTYSLEISSHDPIRIVVEPPFFKSTLGILVLSIIIIFITIIIYLIVSYSTKQSQERMAERRRMEQEAQMMHDKMTFMSNVVHEIKTPLTLIKTPLNNLMRMGHLNSGVDKNLKVISNGVNSLDNLSKELLSFIRVEKCAYKVDMRPTDLADSVNLISFNFSEIIKDRNLQLNIDAGTSPIYVNADSKSLNTIISNLLSNAVKFAHTRISVKVYMQDNEAVLSVSNDGIAIPVQQRDEIFKPFVSLDSGKEAYQHSFGIGLPFSRKLAELQNGTLTLAESDEPEFILKLQVANVTDMMNPSQDQECQTFKEGRSTVLIIEDNLQLCDYLHDKLSDEYNVVSAYSAERGHSILSSRPIDVVVTDLNMPGIGGEELCRRISMDFETSHIPIIVISALSDEDLKLKCIENGANVFIEKPFTVEFLKANISNILDKLSRMRSSAQQDLSGRFNLSRFGIKDRDEEFLQKLSTVVDKHLDDYSFSVKQLEDELFISHSSLNRKLSGLLKMSPLDFIRMRRLIAAAKILEDGNSNVSEVAFMVGFTTPSYFTKCFRKQFGLTPREFIDKKMG